MASFPSYALLLFDGFEETPAAAVQRSSMESGPPKQLRTVSRVMVTRPVKYLLKTKANYTSWETWFRTSINWGADWFDWTDPRDAAVKPARIVAGTYKPVATRKDLERWILTMSIETWSG